MIVSTRQWKTHTHTHTHTHTQEAQYPEISRVGVLGGCVVLERRCNLSPGNRSCCCQEEADGPDWTQFGFDLQFKVETSQNIDCSSALQYLNTFFTLQIHILKIRYNC